MRRPDAKAAYQAERRLQAGRVDLPSCCITSQYRGEKTGVAGREKGDRGAILMHSILPNPEAW